MKLYAASVYHLQGFGCIGVSETIQGARALIANWENSEDGSDDDQFDISQIEYDPSPSPPSFSRHVRSSTLKAIHDAGHGTYPGACPECADLVLRNLYNSPKDDSWIPPYAPRSVDDSACTCGHPENRHICDRWECVK